MRFTRWYSAPVLALLLCGVGPVEAGPEKKAPKELPSFGTLRAPDLEAARSQALTWLKGVGKTDAATQKTFADVWNSDRPLLDKVADTLALGDPEARKLLAEARDPDGPAPTDTPVLLKDPKRPAYFRHNLTLAYARALSNRKVYEETLDALKLIKAEDVVDPSSYLFHKAVAEHALMLKEQAEDSIDRLLVDALDAPERYRMVGALMHFDMLNWREKDLGWISRKMDNIHRRLDLARGGDKTKREQKEVVLRLEEMIKEMENKQKGSSSGNGGSCPSGGSQSGPPNGNRSTNPAGDSAIPNAPPGAGDAEMKKIREIAQVWGKLPEKERARAMVELTRGMPPKYRDAIESYFKELQSKSGAK